jgi:hypothetical protein
MRHVYPTELRDEMAFAERAAASFAENPTHWTFAGGDPEPGQLLALRWGLGNDCVLVVKLDAEHEPTLYAQLIRAAQARKDPA